MPDDKISAANATDDAAAVVAATRTWLERAVIGLNLCPFAKAVHVKGQIRYVVTPAESERELKCALEGELALLAAGEPAVTDTTLLIHPWVLRDFHEYNNFLAEAEDTVAALGLDGVLQVASFHPGYEFADSTPDDMANFTNRSPYPMLHLLREASIDRAVAVFPDAADIFERNIANLRTLGRAGWQRLWVEDD